MRVDRRIFLGSAAALALPIPAQARTAPATLVADKAMAAPAWAQMQRQLLDANAAACEAFYAKYVDPRDDHLMVFERWGANDGPDDAAEATNDWFLLHAMGGNDKVRTLASRFWEGHLRQFTAARTTDVPIARRGMYHREFPVQMDWQHNAEGLTSFNVMGLSIPRDVKLLARTKRFADFYTGRDPDARNYDPRLKMMRSLLNGSRGPMLRQATPLDWAGDPFDPTPFHMEHGETSYQQTLDHYAEYGDVVGDNPLNLQSTTLGLNAYALGGGERYRRWALDYLDAWADRAAKNGDILPSHVRPDGTVGDDWWSGTYGWGFSPKVPQTGKREDRNRVPRCITAFMGAVLMSGDQRYIDLWRRQVARLNNESRMVDGQMSAPTMYGAQGWYGFKPGRYRANGFEIWYMSQRAEDRDGIGDDPWIAYLEGRNPDYPAQALAADLRRVADRVAVREKDDTTPRTRLADWPIDINPASVKSLVQLMTGGLHIARPPWSKTSPPQGGVPLHCRLRYFDPVARRAGVPADVAALVSTLGADQTEVTLVNLHPGEARSVTIQGGAYAEHRIDSATMDGRTVPVGGRDMTLRIEPGCGVTLTLGMTRYANRPTLAFPWDR